jgi:GNAT superfamily N-acetyltransferase
MVRRMNDTRTSLRRRSWWSWWSCRVVEPLRPDPLAAPLLDELTVEYGTRYGDSVVGGEYGELRAYPAEEFAPPGGALIVAVSDGVPVAGGAFRRWDSSTAELKRVWTASTHRRRGYGKLVVVELERTALQGGYTRAYLTTGWRQPEAVALYLAMGYNAALRSVAAARGRRCASVREVAGSVGMSCVKWNQSVVVEDSARPNVARAVSRDRSSRSDSWASRRESARASAMIDGGVPSERTSPTIERGRISRRGRTHMPSGTPKACSQVCATMLGNRRVAT